MEVLQLILNGLMAGTILAVPAIGLTAIFAVLRFTNFALASHMTVGAFAGFVANVSLGWPVVASLLAAFVVAGLVGVATDELILKPFRASGFITTAIGSIALTIALENCVRFAFGNELRGYDLPIRRDWVWGGLHVGPQQVQNLVIARDRHGRCCLPSSPSRAPARPCARSPTIRCWPPSRASMPTWWRGSCRSSPWGLPGSAAC